MPAASSRRRRSTQLFDDAAHPYTQGLLGALPRLEGPAPPARRHSRHRAGAREPAAGLQLRAALRAGGRAVRARRAAGVAPIARRSRVACIRAEPRAARCSGSPPNERAARRGVLDLAQLPDAPRDVRPQRGRARRRWRVARRSQPGRTLGLVGESGCGKSTTGRLVLGWSRPIAARCAFDGEPMPRRGTPALARAAARACRWSTRTRWARSTGACRSARRWWSRWTIHGLGTPAERARRALARLLRAVGLHAASFGRAIRTSSRAASASASCWRAR